jgi:uncharacterized protein with PQ loop repeat
MRIINTLPLIKKVALSIAFLINSFLTLKRKETNKISPFFHSTLVKVVGMLLLKRILENNISFFDNYNFVRNFKLEEGTRERME